MIRDRIKELPVREKISLAITTIWLVIGIMFLLIALPIGNRNIEMRPFITTLLNIYITSVPIIWIVQAVLRRKNVIIMSVTGVIIFALSFWFLILPIIS